jgi:alpha-tubulin suppressor-like RCC1 family protein
MNVISDNSNGDNYPTPVQKMADVIDMSAGGMYGSLFIKSDNTLWSCGKTSLFSVPDNDPVLTSYSVPSQIMSHVQDVDVGYGFGMIIKEDRTLWGYGYNPYIRLGDVATVQADTPVLVTTEVKSVSTGNLHSLILKTDGTLWACGSNSSGQLGDGTTTNRSVPVQVMTGVKSMSAGYNFSLILKNDGTLWACGSNKAGELCDGTTSTRLIPVQVMTDVKGMSAGGGYGGAYYTMGTSHSLILKNDGTVWACGCNEYGQLGDGTTTASPTPKLISLPTK